MGRQKLLTRRYNVYRKALEALGIEIPELSRPTRRSIENAKQIWRRVKYQMQDAGVKLGRVDDVAKGKTDPIGELEARVKIGNIQRLIEEGLHYISHKKSQAGAINVNNSALRLREIIEQAILKHGAEEVAARLEEWAGANDLAELVERLIYATYDPEFARWANGRSAYETLVKGLADALGVDDTMGIIFS